MVVVSVMEQAKSDKSLSLQMFKILLDVTMSNLI